MKPTTALRFDWTIIQFVLTVAWMSLPVMILLNVLAIRSTLEALIAQGVTP